MELSNEEIVTRMLSVSEIISMKKAGRLWSLSNPKYNLGNFLKGIKPEPSPYGDKYIFVR